MSDYGSEGSQQRRRLGDLPDVSNIDWSRIKSQKQSRDPDYLPINQQGRDASARVSLYTGGAWLGVYSIAGLYGGLEGFRNASSSVLRIRMNSVLNGVNKRGSALANTAATMVFLYAGTNWLVDFSRRTPEIEKYMPRSEYFGPVLSGFVTGAVMSSVRPTWRARGLGTAGGIGISCMIHYVWSTVYAPSSGKRRF